MTSNKKKIENKFFKELRELNEEVDKIKSCLIDLIEFYDPEEEETKLINKEKSYAR